MGLKGEMVLYQGRHVPKEGFRVFVYGTSNSKRLVNSWDEYIKACESGQWFSDKEELTEKPKPVKRVKEKNGDST